MLRLFPNGTPIPVEAVYGDLSLPEPPPDRPYVVTNMVSTVDGKITVAGRAAGIGSPVDQLLMRYLRAAADAVLQGAETVRRENPDFCLPDFLAARRQARGWPPHPLGVVVSRSADLPLTLRLLQPGARTVVFVPQSAPADRVAALAGRVTVRVVGTDQVEIGAMLRQLRQEFGVRWLVLEGGPILNYAFFSQGLVDEVFWTIAPKIVGGTGAESKTMVEGPPFPPDRPVRLDLLSCFANGAELFLRYRVQPPNAG
jgi:riboflavin-specific deaminase-like protein